ncbi:hypothetical protein [Streptomyces reniochalinae]
MTAVRTHTSRSHTRPTGRPRHQQPQLPAMSTLPALPKKPLPAGRPRAWYVAHNRQLKAMRLAIALLDTGVYTAEQACDHTIHATAQRIGVHPPSPVTCRLVRSLLP